MWSKLKKLEIPEVLLKGILLLYTNTWVRVRLGIGTSISRKVYTTIGVKQGCVLAPFLFNIYLAELSVDLNKEWGHSPKIMDSTLSNLMYADDIALLSHTKVGLQRLIDCLAKYSDSHALIINRSKTKIMTVTKSRKTKLLWHLKGKQLDNVTEYKYLGVTFDARASFKQHNELLRKKANTLTFAFCKLRTKVMGPSLEPFLKVMEAKLAPSLTYGAEALRGKNARFLDTLLAKIYRRVLCLPRSASPAQIRLEFGNSTQQITNLGMFAKTCHSLREAPVGTLGNLIWEAINYSKESKCNKYLVRATVDLGLEQLWATPVSHDIFKKLVNKMVKKVSSLQDKQIIAKRAHSWSVIGTYALLRRQRYLGESFSLSVKLQLLTYRLGCYPHLRNQKPWEKRSGHEECRLCMEWKEDLQHILCTCPALDLERKRYLKQRLNNNGIRTCRQAMIACLSGDDIPLSGSFIKFMKLAGAKLNKAILP